MSETLSQTVARLTALIQEKAPTVDISPGSVFSELVLNLEAQIQNQVYNDIGAISAVQAISQALASPVATFSPVIDAIASNYNVVRNQGTASSGIIQVFVSTSNNYNIPAGLTFTQPTLGYMYATTSAQTISSGSLLQQNGLYYFTLPVVAASVGQVTAISNGVQFILTNTSQILGFVQAVALGAFTAGLNTESDQQLIARFRNGLGVNNLLSSNSITNQLETQFPAFNDLYVADTTSPINTRSLSNPLGYKIPGCVDVWVKDGATIPFVTFTVTDANWNGTNWIVSLSGANNVAPGFYRIDNVQDADAVTLNYLPVTVTYGFESGAPNLLNTAADARYSVYQTATLTINYTAPVGNQVRNFQITALAVPDLTAMQALFLDPGNRIPCADYLVKGMVPCMVSMSLSLVLANPNSLINIAGLQTQIFDYINSLPQGQTIATSQIVAICHAYSNNIARVDLPLVLNGTIYAPYNSVSDVTDNNITIAGTDFLQIPSLPAQGVTPENTMFYVSYFDDTGNQNINISVS